MTVLVFESNLMWSARLVNAVRTLGHEGILLGPGVEPPAGDVAILNLGEAAYDPPALVGKLKAAGVAIIAHAGHKEKELLDLGRGLNVEILATNSQMAHKLPDLLERAAARG